MRGTYLFRFRVRASAPRDTPRFAGAFVQTLSSASVGKPTIRTLQVTNA